ncbi:MAG TPA: winged helix-turn-helix domain-containing protein [Verrucomicrobiae bacterium]|nr:winged helix-turn-helix domain-containing protein [Verrucomicrobiae bacterium]
MRRYESSQVQEQLSSPKENALNVLEPVSVEKNIDFAAMLKILDEKCRKCTPITPLECISRCKTWKLKNELRILHKNSENPDFIKDVMNVLKNETRLQILMMINKGRYSISKLQQQLRKAGHSLSQDNMMEEYLNPLLEAGLALEVQDLYRTTTFGSRLTELIQSSANILSHLPAHSECHEETVLKALLSGPKTFDYIAGVVPQKIVSRILRRLEKAGLVETPKERAYIFFFRSKRDPAKEKFSYAESKVYNSIFGEGISAQKLVEKTGFVMRTVYKSLRGLRGKKLVFNRKMIKGYCLTAKGEKFALVLDELYSLVEETMSSSEQVFKDNENIVPPVSGLSDVRYPILPSKLSLLAEDKAEPMKRSQLEVYVDILEVLAYEGPLMLTRVMHDVNVNCSMVKAGLDFLNKQGLVEDKINRKERKIYEITQRGVTVLTQFKALKEVLPMVVETGNEVSSKNLVYYKAQIL